MHQALNLAKAQGKAPGAVEETVRDAHRSTLDWRSLLRRYMTDATARDYSWSVPNRRFIDSGALPPLDTLGRDGHPRRHHRHLGFRGQRRPRRVLVGGARGRRRDRARPHRRTPGRRRRAGRRALRARRAARADRRQGPLGHRLPAGLRPPRRAGHPARRVPVFHGHGLRPLPRGGARLSCGLDRLQPPPPGCLRTPRPGASTSGSTADVGSGMAPSPLHRAAIHQQRITP